MIHPHVYGQVSMAANFNKHITLDFNCGYAQVAVRELATKGRWKSATYITERAPKFRDLFDTNEKYGLQSLCFEANDKKPSQFSTKTVKRWCRSRVNGGTLAVLV